MQVPGCISLHKVIHMHIQKPIRNYFIIWKIEQYHVVESTTNGSILAELFS